jgi:hypothetical protein
MGGIFAGLYALYAGLVFLVAAGLVFAPVLHRLSHKFHWGEDHSAYATRHSLVPSFYFPPGCSASHCSNSPIACSNRDRYSALEA